MTTATRLLRSITRAVPLPLWLGLALCLLAPVMAAASQWNPQDTVDGSLGSGAGQYVSLALGGDGKLHMSYLSGTSTYNLNYATGLPGSWTLSYSLYAGTNVLAGTAIAVDPANLPHIAYYVGSSTNLLQTIYKTGPSTWSSSVTVDSNFTPQADSSAALFFYKGGAHISYYRQNRLNFANYSGGSTTKKIVDSSTTGAGEYSGAVVDSHGKFHVVYYDATNYRLMYAYATSVSGTWTTAQVGVPTYAGGYCAVAIDAQDNLHVSYIDATDYIHNNYRVKYITKPYGGAWSAPVDIGPSWVSGYKSGFTSIAVDRSGFAHISYYGNSTALMYATNLGGGWSTETVPADGGSTDYGMYSSIKVDGNGTVYIAYYDVNKSSLKVASKSPLLATPSPAALGTVDRGFQSSPNTTITITNNLPASQTLGAISKGGANPGDFTIVSDACSSLTLIPQGTCTLQLYFAPPVSDPRSSARTASLAIPSTVPYVLSNSATLTGSTSANYLLTAGAGNGGGISPAIVAAAPNGSQTFTVTPNSGFSIASVTDSVSGPMNAPYTLTNIAVDHTLTAAFASPIRISNTGIYYGALASAYGAANDGWTIQSQVTIPEGDLLVNRNISTALSGGYDTSFTSQTGATVMLGNLIVSNGTINLEALIFQ